MVKIGDLGIARILSRTNECVKTMVGTPYYLSPEIVQNKPYNFKSDIWSLGVMLYELCALKPPFDGTSLQMLGMRITRGNYPPLPRQFSKPLVNLVSLMLNINTAKRPNIHQVLKQTIVQDRIQNFLTKTVLNDEFSHTIFHKQQVFDKNGEKQEVNGVDQIKSNLALIEKKRNEERKAQPIKTYEPPMAQNKPSTPSNNFHYKNKPTSAPFQVGYSNPNNVGKPAPRPKYTPPSISDEESKRRQERDRERELARIAREEKEQKLKEKQKEIEKKRLEQWRKDYEEKQKVDLQKQQKELLEKQREAERMRQQSLMEMQKAKDNEKILRSNLYYQARQEAELNKLRHLESERNNRLGIFDDPTPPPKPPPKKTDLSGDISNNQYRQKANYHYKNKHSEGNPFIPRPQSNYQARKPEPEFSNSQYEPVKKPKEKEVADTLQDFFPPAKRLEAEKQSAAKPSSRQRPQSKGGYREPELKHNPVSAPQPQVDHKKALQNVFQNMVPSEQERKKPHPPKSAHYDIR